MKLNKTKSEIIREATLAAANEVDCAIYELYDKLHLSVSMTIRKAVLKGIEASLVSIMSNIHTQEDFEQDMGLNG